MRHFFASLLIRNGASVKTVQAMLGHKRATETGTPARTFGDADEQTRAIAGGALARLRKGYRMSGVLEQT